MSLSTEEKRVLSKKRQKTHDTRLPVYISNDHNDALVNLHAAIRCGEVSFAGIGMVHVDSHPDLMVPPDMPARMVFEPRELHHHLSCSECGIAEFILPAVFGGHVNRIWWVRPPWSNQICDGTFQFHVGRKKDEEDGPLRVTFEAPYFYDEGLVEPLEFLDQVKPVDLHVSMLPETSGESFLRGHTEWILDICLDYFSVHNPFYMDLQTRFGVETARTFFEVYAGDHVKWRKVENERTLRNNGAEKKQEQDRLRAIFDKFVDLTFSNKPEEARDLVKDCFDDLEEEAYRFIEKVQSCTSEERELMKTCGPNLDLPHHKSDNALVETMLSELENRLRAWKPQIFQPRIVTIAKSSSEEFDYTPKDQISWILDKTLSMLGKVYGENLDISYDDE